jgi:hypothetical protein
MIVDKNSTKKANSTETNSTTEGKEAKSKLSPKLSFAELEKDDDKPLDAKKNATTNSTDVPYEKMYENMTFAVNETLNKGWPIRRDDGFPY